MKNRSLNYLVIAAFAISAAFTSCEKNNDDNGKGNGTDTTGNGNEKVQLVKTITWDFNDYSYYQEFKYDEKNRLTTVTTHADGQVRIATFTYSGDDLVKFIDYPDGLCMMDFSKNGNKIGVTTTEGGNIHKSTFELNSDGYPITFKSEDYVGATTYQYSDGNLVSIAGEMMYKHDNKKSPFYDCKSPKWFRFPLGLTDPPLLYYLGIKNNITEMNITGEMPIPFTYEYDENGFPTKMLFIGYVVTFTYK